MKSRCEEFIMGTVDDGVWVAFATTMALAVMLAGGMGCSEDSAASGQGDADTSSGVLPSGEPYQHVIPVDVGVTIGAGVSAALPTSVYQGPMTISEVGTVIENVVLNGCLRIEADNVVIRNVIVHCDGLYPIQAHRNTSGLLVEYSHIDCTSHSKNMYIQDHRDAVIRNNELTGCEDFFFIGGDVGNLLIENNFMHSLVLTPESHADGFQIGEASETIGTITIRGNYINPDAEGGKNDIVFATNYTAATLEIESNYFHVWGLRTIRCVTDEVICHIRYNVYDDAFRTVQTDGGKRVFLQTGENTPTPVFECNVYPDGTWLEDENIVDRIWGTDHVTEGCPLYSQP